MAGVGDGWLTYWFLLEPCELLNLSLQLADLGRKRFLQCSPGLLVPVMVNLPLLDLSDQPLNNLVQGIVISHLNKPTF